MDVLVGLFRCYGERKFGLVPLAMSAAGLSTGTRVTLCGLQARPELNGKSGRVLVKKDATSGRCGATCAVLCHCHC